MSRRGGPLDRVALVAVAALTTWFATWAWRGFTEEPGRFLQPLALLAVVVAATGMALRAARLPGSVVVPLQLILTAVVAASLAAGAPVVSAEGWLTLGDRLAAAVSSAQKYPAPVPASVPPVAPLLVLGGWACLVAVDVCVGTLRRVPLAGLPLLTIYSVPVSLLLGGVPWWSFAGAAAGFLLLLFLQQRDATHRWGRGLATAEPGSRHTSPAVRNAAGSMGAAALVLAVLLPQFVPTLSLSVFGFGPGAGTGGDITVENPMADLRRDLLRDEDLPLLRVTTDNPNPSYLRIAALTRFSDNEWSTGDRDIPEDQVADGALPLTDIDPAIPRQRFEHRVSALAEFDSRWLPTTFPAERVVAEGDWRYDVTTLDFLAADDDGDLDTAGLDYEMTELVLDLDGRDLADAPTWSGKVSRDLIDLPDGFPAFVRSLAQEVTRDHPSRYEKAVALQQWFREDGGFSYSLDNVPSGNGTDELVTFLTEGGGGRVGYCEQFAAAMAVMARSLGIPARVAVGFLTPEPLGGDTWEYSTFDLHAWPELYFADAGWVRFEPTPADRVPGVPAYTEDRIPQPDDPASPQGPEESPGGPQDPARDPRLDEGALPEGQDPGGIGGVAWLPLLGTLGGALLVLVIGLLPRTLRRAATRARLQGEVEAAWQELRASVLDLGLAWPEQRSPQETRRHLVPLLADPGGGDAEISARGAEAAPAAHAALGRLAHAVERARYAPPAAAEAREHAVVSDTRTVVASLRAGVSQRARRRAEWWPVSVLPWRRTAAPLAPALISHGGVVDHVG